MLLSLSISNYALISHLEIEFKRGMNVITGETGAGKSIIIGAIGLVSGQRADTRIVKEGEKKSVIETEFDVSNYSLEHFFEENNLDYDKITTIRREIATTGKSRAFINDTPVSLSVLKELTNQLIDVHSQHENLILANQNYQMNVVDSVANNIREREIYQKTYTEWKVAKSNLNQLRETIEQQKTEYDYLAFQYRQLEEADLKADEQEELEAEQETLGNVEEIKIELEKINVLLNNDENNTLNSLKEANSTLNRIVKYLPNAEKWANRIESCWIELKDISQDVSSTQERLEYDPERLEYINNRLSLMYDLQLKFRLKNNQELLEKQEELKTILDSIEMADESLLNAEKDLRKKKEQLKQQAEVLSQSRKAIIPLIEKRLINSLKELGMPNINLAIQIEKNEIYTENGNDKVEFLFSANKNRALRPVAEIASGGEISRFMLAIKSMLVEKVDLPTIIFDEIDTGVSGEIAEKMGLIMKNMSKNTQVFTITHLPQIASKGTNHFKVYKEIEHNETITKIKELSNNERVSEIAQMLSGSNITDTALQNAKELLGSIS